MNQDKILQGFWWRPEVPEKTWYGVLDHSDDKLIELTCYSDSGTIALVSEPTGGVIHGRDVKGRPVTLLVANIASSQGGGAASTLVRHHAGYALIGSHVQSRTSFRAGSVFLGIQCLYGWLGMSGFGTRKVGAPGTSSRFSQTIAYDLPQEQRHEYSPGEEIAFGMNAKSQAKRHTASIEEQAYVSFTSSKGLTVDDAWNLSTTVRHLIHLSVLRPVFASSMFLHDVQCESCTDQAKEVEVWSMNFRPDDPSTHTRLDWVFTYGDHADGFGAFFSKWLDIRSRYGEAMGCYTSTVYAKMPIQVEHLCLTQALDAFHSWRHDSFRNHNFRDKLQDLCRDNRTALAGLVDDVDTFATTVQGTRNWYTHHNPKWLIDGKEIESSDLIRLNEKLAVLFRSCILQELGIPEDRLRRLQRRLAASIIKY